MDFMCRKCGTTTFYLQQKSIAQVGMYCDCCGAWGKWVGKKELLQYQRRGYHIYGQNVDVKLKGAPVINHNNQGNGIGDLGFESVPINVGVQNLEVNNTPIISQNSFGQQPQSLVQEPLQAMPNNIDIEAEVERRVSERLMKISKQELLNKQLDFEEKDEYCSVCDGNPLEPDGEAKVEVSIMGGVLMVTDVNGCNILGVYKVDRCPKCGRKFKKEETVK